MDFRAYLAPSEPVVLPYFGGTRVDSRERRFRLAAPAQIAPGWWRFRIEGRRVVPLEPAAAALDLAALPVLRGHWVAGWVVASGRELARIALPPDDEPPALARVTARRWFSGDWLFDTTDFEDDAELAARRALEERRPLAGDVRGIVPSLRAAFGYAVGTAVAAELGIRVALRELTPRVVAIADGGAEAATAHFVELVARRERAEAEARERVRWVALTTSAHDARVRRRAADPRDRADEALASAGARMLGCVARAQRTQLDVTYEVDGTRLISLVDAETLQVLDPGICLSGAHRVLTLDAMPSVVREAVEDDRLNITRSP
jgi:hypothetical protein